MRLSIAIIDPDPAARRWLRLAMDDISVPYDATEFSSLVQALALLRQSTYRFDWVFVNHRLPLFEIDEAITNLKRLRSFSGSRIVVTTICDTDNVPRGCARLTKSVRPEDLGLLLRRIPIAGAA